jgi:hypothetical protein
VRPCIAPPLNIRIGTGIVRWRILLSVHPQAPNQAATAARALQLRLLSDAPCSFASSSDTPCSFASSSDAPCRPFLGHSYQRLNATHRQRAATSSPFFLNIND